MKQSLQLRIAQQLNLTPQLAQSIKLLQLSTLDFQQEIERYLAENPLLERDDGGQGGEAEDAAPVESSPAESVSAYQRLPHFQAHAPRNLSGLRQ